ncbi:hypothetical protein [Actinomycetospora chiangmaiensis]|uniref:hypothetical protein n=1 Tax=Actinomycetospora chiangmaiensis TaxID=402650 RepID=UPI0003742E51|nr:hypothetical protein [Actinomycetospora chiangmaiensis]
MEQVVGLSGVLSTRTRGADGAGELELPVRGGRATFFAWSDEPLPAGTTVLVVGARSGATVDVVRWLDPTSALDRPVVE